MFDVDNTQAQSVTATVCENAQLYGATPERDEFDPRDVWDEDDAMDAVSEAFRIIAEGVALDGFQLADERESLLWGFVNTFDAQVRRLDRSVDRLSPELRDLQREQDGTEIKSRELELVTDRAQNLGDRRDAFEKMRDLAADAYRAETGDTWRPRRDAVPRRMALAWAEFATLRQRLLKIGARIVEKAARIRIHFASACPDATRFPLLAGRLAASGP